MRRRVHDALARDDADELRAAHDGKFFLQRVDAAYKRIGKCVRRRESGEVSEHYFAHTHGIDNRLEKDALFLNLRADHDEQACEAKPVIAKEHAGKHCRECEHLAQACGSAACWAGSVLAREYVADEPPAIERISRQQMQEAEKRLHPHHAAQQMRRVMNG